MNLHTDLPTHTQIDRLLTSRHPASVSIYLATSPTSPGEAERIELKNLAGEARRQLESKDLGRTDLPSIDESIDELADDEAFWRHQARSLAIFVTPDSLVAFRLPNQLTNLVEVSDRFHVKPLLRAVTFPNAAFVLALAQGSVRLLEIVPELGAAEVVVPELPQDVAAAAGKSSITDRGHAGRTHGSEGQKMHMRRYARLIDQALRPVLSASELPLVVAAAEPLASIYRAVNTYPHLAPSVVSGNPEALSDVDLVASARAVLDETYASELQELHELYRRRASELRASADIVDVARAATFGAVDTVFADIDEVVPGLVDEGSGAVTFLEEADAVGYGVVDEIVRRVWLTGGRVLAVRRDDIPGSGSVAAILRYPV